MVEVVDTARCHAPYWLSGLVAKPNCLAAELFDGVSSLNQAFLRWTARSPNIGVNVRRGRARQLPADALASVATVNLAPDDLISTDRVQSIAGTHLLTFQYS